MVDVAGASPDWNGMQHRPPLTELGELGGDLALADDAPVPALGILVDYDAVCLRVDVDRAEVPLVQKLVNERMPRNPLSKIAHLSSMAGGGGCQ